MFYYKITDKNGNVVNDNATAAETAQIIGMSKVYLGACLKKGRNEFNGYTIEQICYEPGRKGVSVISEKEALRMYKMYQCGYSIALIAASERKAQITIKRAFDKYGLSLRTKKEIQDLKNSVRNKTKAEAIPLPREEDPFYDREIKDLGKVSALRKAGWTINEIAKEFISTEKEVKRCLEVLKMK